MTEPLAKLEGNEKMKGEGSWVFTHQGVAAEEGFKNVSKAWLAKTQTYDEGLEAMEKDRAETEDLILDLRSMKPAVAEGKFVMQAEDGRTYRPTAHAVAQMGDWAGCGSWYIQSLMTSPTNQKGDQLYSRDEGDAHAIAVALTNGFRRRDQEKKFLWRTRQDGTLRAMLTTEYARIDNRWFVNVLKTVVPGGRLSHWRGDSDTLWGNVLIPDTIRAEADSDYGGMLSVGNSEIGERKVSSRPSIFRAICMNGCIWGAKEGEGIKYIHRGKLELVKLFEEIKENLEQQIPLLPSGIEHLLSSREMTWEGQSVKPLFATVVNDFRLTRQQGTAILEGYNDERRVAGDTARSLFGVIAAVTRAGQKLPNQQWVKLDEVGGSLSNFDRDDWASMTKRAKAMRAKDVDAAFASLAV